MWYQKNLDFQLNQDHPNLLLSPLSTDWLQMLLENILIVFLLMVSIATMNSSMLHFTNGLLKKTKTKYSRLNHHILKVIYLLWQQKHILTINLLLTSYGSITNATVISWLLQRNS